MDAPLLAFILQTKEGLSPFHSAAARSLAPPSDGPKESLKLVSCARDLQPDVLRWVAGSQISAASAVPVGDPQRRGQGATSYLPVQDAW